MRTFFTKQNNTNHLNEPLLHHQKSTYSTLDKKEDTTLGWKEIQEVRLLVCSFLDKKNKRNFARSRKEFFCALYPEHLSLLDTTLSSDTMTLLYSFFCIEGNPKNGIHAYFNAFKKTNVRGIYALTQNQLTPDCFTKKINHALLKKMQRSAPIYELCAENSAIIASMQALEDNGIENVFQFAFFKTALHRLLSTLLLGAFLVACVLFFMSQKNHPDHQHAIPSNITENDTIDPSDTSRIALTGIAISFVMLLSYAYCAFRSQGNKNKKTLVFQREKNVLTPGQILGLFGKKSIQNPTAAIGIPIASEPHMAR